MTSCDANASNSNGRGPALDMSGMCGFYEKNEKSTTAVTSM
ncbi:MAG TPA: hypothetical protein VGM98_20415 [Schlesneria sp.]